MASNKNIDTYCGTFGEHSSVCMFTRISHLKEFIVCSAIARDGCKMSVPFERQNNAHTLTQNGIWLFVFYHNSEFYLCFV